MNARLKPLVLASILLAGLAGCKEEVKIKEDIRPVRYTVAGAAQEQGALQFSGEIRARHESRLAFRVAGKIVEKRVNNGDSVKQGQVLLVLDSNDYMLDQQAKQAQLAAAEAQLRQQQADLKRSQDLQSQAFISQAQLDRQQAAFSAAQAQVLQARAALQGSRNQQGYTQLLADRDGVISDIQAEAGMVVAAGQPVARLAASGPREVMFQVAESQLAQLRTASSFSVTLPATGKSYAANLRELAADADPATRSYAARLSLADADALSLGMTAKVSARLPQNSQPAILLPHTAILDQQGKQYVWLLDATGQKVGRKPVSIRVQDKQFVQVTAGLQGGEKVVTAGVHLLRDGQTVTLLKP